MNINLFEKIILDCDGVIFDSNDLKTRAFRDVLANYHPEAVEGFIKYHQTHGGVSRYKKIEVFFEKFLQRLPSQEEQAMILENFGNACKKGYEIVPFTPGITDFLNRLSVKKNLFVASGSDEKELIEVFKKRGIFSHFNSILGSPKDKQECLNLVIEMPPIGSCLFLGDSFSDWVASKTVGIPFIFIADFSDEKDKILEIAKTEKVPVVGNFFQLLEEYGK